MATWQVFQRGLEIEAERQFRIYILRRITVGAVVGFILGLIVGYGIR